MKLFPLLSAILISGFSSTAQIAVHGTNKHDSKRRAAVFEENKGQMKDQHWKPRPDVLFYGNQQAMNYYIKKDGVSFQLSRVDSWREEEQRPGMPDKLNRKVPDQISTYRVDAQWIGYNADFKVEQGSALDGYNNYYNVPEGVEPALFVKQYESVTLKNVWGGIDIHYYGTDGQLETDYLVAPGADYRQIKMEIRGAELSTSNDGHLIMKTPFGEIREGELKVYQGGERLDAFWKIEAASIVSLTIPNYDPDLALRIDPLTRLWGTYYGGSGDEFDSGKISTDASGNIFLSGRTTSASSIASGGHQNSYIDSTDAFLVKFNSSGIVMWATYYGGSGSDVANSVATDITGNIFLAGNTSSPFSIASGGYKNTYSGGAVYYGDAFLVKFNTNGIRQWSTYYGGTGDDAGWSISTDALGSVYLSGCVDSMSTSGIASNGNQNLFGGGSYDAFLVKFNGSGVRQWGTYYGGIGGEYGWATSTDSNGNIYLSGSTSSSNAIAFGGYQNTYSDSGDAFLVKFSSSGVRLWGTYYGGVGADFSYSTTTDLSGNVYLAGATRSDSSVAFGGHQSSYGGGQWDVFLVKLNSNGVRQWCTYYGGSGTEFSYSTTTDPSGNVYLEGRTFSTTNIASAGYQNTIGGGYDAFLVKFNSGGIRLWGTYYGGSSSDRGISTALDPVGNIYLAGSTSSTTSIASGGYQNFCAGGSDAFLVKFSQPLITSQPPTQLIACTGSPTTLSLSATAGSGLTYQWQLKSPSSSVFSNMTAGGVNLFSGVNSSILNIGNPAGLNGYTFQCVVSNGSVSETSSTTVLTVYTSPTASITADGASANPATINLGDATSLSLSGSFSSTPNISWTPSSGLSSTTVSDPIAYPSSTTTYTATFTNTYGCTQSVSQQVVVNSLPNSGAISVVSGTGVNSYSVFDTLQVQVRLIGVTNIYAAYARLRYSGALAPYMTYVGYTAGTILGTGAAVISTPPVASGTYGYDFGISKIGAAAGYAGTGTLYTFYFKPNNIPSNLIGSQVCFYVDNLSITSATTGASLGLVNQGPSCFSFTNQVNVWPGDLDNNKTVNTADLLKIGIFYNNTGPARPNASLQWVAQPATLWGLNTSSPNSDAYKVFVDGNGDGIINNADQASVGFNMSRIHAFVTPTDHQLDGSSFPRLSSTGNLVVTPTPGYVNSNQLPRPVELQVSLANSGGMLNNLYGISFDIAVDTTVFDLQNTTFDYGGSIFGTPSQDFLNIEYVANCIVSVGMTRFNNPSINGNGLLCKIRLNTYPTLNLSATNLVFNGTVVAANDSIGTPYAISPVAVQIPYGPTASVAEAQEQLQVMLYPNPAKAELNLIMGRQVLVREIKVLDETGRVVLTQAPNQLMSSYQLNIADLATGIYTLQLSTNNEQLHKRFVKGGN